MQLVSLKHTCALQRRQKPRARFEQPSAQHFLRPSSKRVWTPALPGRPMRTLTCWSLVRRSAAARAGAITGTMQPKPTWPAAPRGHAAAPKPGDDGGAFDSIDSITHSVIIHGGKTLLVESEIAAPRGHLCLGRGLNMPPMPNQGRSRAHWPHSWPPGA